jgi:hypothetical protein
VIVSERRNRLQRSRQKEGLPFVDGGPQLLPEDLVKRRARLGPALDEKLKQGQAIAADLDKALLSLSGGALVFSMTFVGTLAPARLVLNVLFSAWIAFGLSIVWVVSSMRAAQNLNVRSLTEMADVLEKLNRLEEPGDFPRVMRSSKWIPILNNAAIAAFVIGVMLLGFFVGYNLMFGPLATPRTSVPA